MKAYRFTTEDSEVLVCDTGDLPLDQARASLIEELGNDWAFALSEDVTEWAREHALLPTIH